MDSAYEVSDPTDWHNTPLSSLTAIDASLRCQVCKDYFNTPVITSCSHTFCSLCIRRCLAADGQCPACRTAEQEIRLRRNVTLQEVTDAFVSTRQSILKVAREAALKEEAASTPSTYRGPKRKRSAEEELEKLKAGPRTRSQRRKADAQNIDGSSDLVAVEENIDEEDSEYVPEDGLVPCPICNKRMKAEDVFSHLDRCEDEMVEGKRSKQRTPGRSHTAPTVKQQPLQPPQERLAQLNYSLLNDKALRKKLAELGIPNFGSKALLIRRHTEWIALWNSNCDSPRPRSKRELLADLDTWERSQGGHAPNGGAGQPSAVMRKDFDGEAWARKNKNDFDLLITNARQKRTMHASNYKSDNEGSETPASITATSDSPALPIQPKAPAPLHVKSPQSSSSPYPLSPELTRVTSKDTFSPIGTSPHSPPSIFTQLDRLPPNHPRRASVQLEANGASLSPRQDKRSGLTHDASAPSISSTNSKKQSESATTNGRSPEDVTTGPEPNTLRHASMNFRGTVWQGEGATRKMPMFGLPEEPLEERNGGTETK